VEEYNLRLTTDDHKWAHPLQRTNMHSRMLQRPGAQILDQLVANRQLNHHATHVRTSVNLENTFSFHAIKEPCCQMLENTLLMAVANSAVIGLANSVMLASTELPCRFQAC